MRNFLMRDFFMRDFCYEGFFYEGFFLNGSVNISLLLLSDLISVFVQIPWKDNCLVMLTGKI